MDLVKITNRQFEALQADVRERFERRIIAFLEEKQIDHSIPSDRRYRIWREYLQSAYNVGLVSERETAAYMYICCLSQQDVAKVDCDLVSRLQSQSMQDERFEILSSYIEHHIGDIPASPSP